MGFLISNGHCIHVIEFFGGLGKFPFTQNEATWFESNKNQKTWLSMPKVPIALCKLQGVNVELLMANARGQGPIAKCQLQCAIAKCQGQIANCKGPRARNFTQEGPTPIKNIPTLEKNQGFDSKGFEFQSWIAMVLVQISIGQCQGAKGQRPIANYQLRGARGQRPKAHCKGPGARDFREDTQKSCKTISNSEQNQGFG